MLGLSSQRRTETVAFQGENGAYSQEAARQFFGAEVGTLPCRSFEDIFRAVEQGKADYGILPIENSMAGSINKAYDLLLDYDLKIWGEVLLANKPHFPPGKLPLSCGSSAVAAQTTTSWWPVPKPTCSRSIGCWPLGARLNFNKEYPDEKINEVLFRSPLGGSSWPRTKNRV